MSLLAPSGRSPATVWLAVPATLAISILVFSSQFQTQTRQLRGDDVVNNESQAENPFPGRTRAPSLDGGTDWFNTSHPVTLRELRGKIVLLDFWTYCCINCMHVLPDLKYLEDKFARQLVVVGVHSAKFDNEKVSENIRQAVLRYGIRHPVVNDANQVLWRKLNVRAWPTLVVIDPEGYYCGYVSGEGNRPLLEQAIGALIKFHRTKGTLNETPIQFTQERDRESPTPLRFPGKVLADAATNRLFVADSSHNRIIVCTLEGALLDIIGDGSMGQTDGAYDTARFDHPQGMALVGDSLYVADTENHLIRVVDLKQKRVSTLAGTGQQARGRAPGGPLRTTALNSPWDLVHVRGTLFVAMAGPHQIWSHRLGSDSIRVYAGNGREDVRNGPADECAFAQPSGIDSDGRSLFVADSEGSAVRRLPVQLPGEVVTIAGTSDLPRGRSLFAFGDRDGNGDQARFQHPLGVAYRNGALYVADTYNHKIKRVDAGTGQVTTILPTTHSTTSDAWKLSEPGGLSFAGDKLYIADTNHHRVCVWDLDSGTATTLTIRELNPPAAP